MIGNPDAVFVAGAWADGEAQHDGCIDGFGKRNDLAPLIPCQNTVIAIRCFADVLTFEGQIGLVGPSPADAHIGWRKLPRERTKFGIVKRDRRAHAIHLVFRPAIGCPETTAGHFDHLDIVGLKSLIDLPNGGQGCVGTGLRHRRCNLLFGLWYRRASGEHGCQNRRGPYMVQGAFHDKLSQAWRAQMRRLVWEILCAFAPPG